MNGMCYFLCFTFCQGLRKYLINENVNGYGYLNTLQLF